jgi:hypothetical protein
MADVTCVNCGEEVDEAEAIEQNGFIFCSEECADEYDEEE